MVVIVKFLPEGRKIMRQIVLASGSPRRKELLEQIGISFEIQKSGCEEIITSTIPYEVVQELSKQKAEDVWNQLSKEEQRQKMVLGADTIVSIHDKILGKPKSKQHAIEMLRELSGNIHHVFTGVTLIFKDKQENICTHTFYEDTQVEMYPMSDQEITDYVATGEPMDKAGAYAIQGKCAPYIKGIHGEYSNVVGLPIARLYQELKKCE